MQRRPPGTQLTDPLFPYTALFRSQPRARPQAVGRASLRIAELERPALDDRDVPVLAGTLAGIRSRKRGPAAGGSRMKVLVLASLAYSLVNFRRDLLAAMAERSEEHTSEVQSLMRISYAVFCL